VKIRLIPWTLLISLLFACAPSRPQIPLPEVPAGPLVQAIQQRREAFQSLRAVAKVRIERQGRARVYESVAFIQKGQDRLRIEGFGVLGESLFTAVWDGKDVLMASASEGEVHRMGPAGFERLLGVALSPADLCAVLTGNGAPVPPDAEARAGCRSDGRCVVEFRAGDARSLVTLIPLLPEHAGDAMIESVERYQGGGLVFRSRFESAESIGGYRFPRRVVVESPGRKIAVTIEYEDIDVNVPVGDGAFVLSREDGR
jgi:hypothetical protein